MGKTPSSTRASRKPNPKQPERKWCTCQERCDGGKEVAASTYRSHNPTTARSTNARDGSTDGGGGPVRGKRKAMDGGGEMELESGGRETRRMRAKRLARNGETMVVAVAEDINGTLQLDAARTGPPKGNKREYRKVQIQGHTDDDGESDEDGGSTWTPSAEAYNPIENGKEIDEDYEDDDQLRATLRAVNEMVFAILSWD